MEIIPGILVVEEIEGRRGRFSVGMLKTSIGDFKVKDSALDQFSPGDYKGRFMVESIYASSEPWRGGFYTSLRARICRDGYLIEEQNELPTVPTDQPAAQPEPDPLDTPSLAELLPQNQPLPDAATPPSEAELPGTSFDSAKPAVASESLSAADGENSAENDPDIKLFGYEIGPAFKRRENIIRLDTSVDREMFRQQRNRLKDVGYRFDPKTQQWML